MTKDIILLRYINAVENGDLETLQEIWRIALDDTALTRELLDISAEIGGVPMYHNGLVRPAPRPARSIPRRTAYRRVALFLIAIAGLLMLLALFSQDDSPIVTAPISGSTPTILPSESLLPIGVYNVDQLTQIAQYGEGTVRGIEWTPDGDHIIAYGSPGYWIYDVNNLDAEPVFVDLNRSLFDVGFTEDGDTIIFGGRSNTSDMKLAIYMADLETGETTYTLETGLEAYGHLETGNGLILYHDWSSGRLYGWDIAKKRERFVYTPAKYGNIVAIDFEEETGVVGILSSISNEEGFILSLIDTNTGDEVESRELDVQRDPQMPSGASQYGRLLVEQDRVIVVSDVAWFEWDANFETGRLTPSGRHPLGNDSPAVAVFDLIALHDDEGVLVQRTSGHTPLYLYRDEYLVLVDYSIPETAYFSGMTLHPERNEVLYLNRESVEIVDAISGDVIDTVPVKNWRMSVYDMVYDQDRLITNDWHNVIVRQSGNTYTSPDKIAPITGVLPGDDIIYLLGSAEQFTSGIIAWDYKNGTYEEVYRLRMGRATGWTISHDRQDIYYSAMSGFVHQFDLSEGRDIVLDQPPGIGPNNELSNFTVSPDGRYLALTHGRHIFIYDLENEAFLDPLSGHSAEVNNLFFKADGFRMYSLDSSQNWIVWDTGTWAEIEYRENVPTGIRTVLSPDGTLIVTTSIDEMVFLDARTFEETYRLGDLSDVTFSDDGKRIISYGADGIIRVWGVPQ